MGVSTDGVIFYGYVWKDEHDINNERAEEVWGDGEPVIVGSHGSDEWRQPYIYVAESRIRAARGYPERLNLEEIISRVQPIGWRRDLEEFCKRFDIDVSEAEGPGWFLVSWWG